MASRAKTSTWRRSSTAKPPEVDTPNWESRSQNRAVAAFGSIGRRRRGVRVERSASSGARWRKLVDRMLAKYVYRVRFRVDAPEDVRVRPATFEATVAERAAVPGEDGWLYFRDNCWRGDVADQSHARALAEDALGVPVVDVSFRSLRTDTEYYDALQDAIADDLTAFNADSVDEALAKYLGSSIDVVDDPGL